LQHPSAKTLEPAGRVPHRQAGHGTRVDVGEIAEQEPTDRPIHDRHLTVAVARAEHEIGVVDRTKELGEMRRVVREIGVHLEDVVVAALECPLEASNVRGPEA
jgi:hypothetical protein